MSRFGDNLAALVRNVAILDAQGARAHRTLRTLGSDGYPSGSGFDAMGRSANAGSSTERAALAPDELRRKSQRLEELVVRLQRMSLEATSLCDQALAPPPKPKRDSQVTACANCKGPAVPRAKKGRCLACYEYQRRTGLERPT